MNSYVSLSATHLGFITAFQDPKSPLLRSDEAFRAYVTSLTRTDKSNSVQAAVRRRDSLLAASTPTDAVSDTPESAVDVAPSSEAAAQPVTPPPAPANAPAVAPRSSQEIAMSVLAARSDSPFNANTAGTDSSKTPFDPTSPVQVTIVEREFRPGAEDNFSYLLFRKRCMGSSSTAPLCLSCSHSLL